jgi:hypothetical protein
VLTAAHVAAEWNPFVDTLTFNGKHYGIEKVIVNPVFLSRGLDSGMDFALIKLKEPVEGVQPIQLYGGTDEVGKEVTFVGAGETGNGKTGPTHDDGVKRAANNVVNGIRGGFITFLFDPPSTALPLEGISGPGDSGGPAIITVDGQLFTIGVSTANDAPPGKVCQYGSTEMYARVSNGRSWLEATMKADPVGTATWTKPVAIADWAAGDGFEGKTLLAYLAAFNTGKPEEVERFNKEFRSSQYLKDTTEKGRTDRARTLIDEYGVVSAEQVCTGPDHAIAMLLRSSKTGEALFIRPIFAPNEPGKVRGFVMQALK